MKKFIIFIIAVVFGGILIGTASTLQDEEKYKTAEEWAVHHATEDFLSIREEDEPFYYTIENIYPKNFTEEIEGDHFEIFRIVMTDSREDEETFLFEIEYNNYNNIFSAILGNKKFSKEDIVRYALHEN